jgi:outer membrane protein assembly factor BamB
MCGALAASAERFACAGSRAFRGDQIDYFIVAYTPEGRELWRHALESGVRVRQMKLLDSGDLIYSYYQSDGVAVERLDPSGRRVWNRHLRSIGPYTFVSTIETLADGRLSFLGTTGPWNGFTSDDTDAMVLVTGASERDLDVPEVVTHVVDWP